MRLPLVMPDLDLPAPTTGRVVQKSVAEGEIVAVNQVLGMIQAA